MPMQTQTFTYQQQQQQQIPQLLKMPEEIITQANNVVMKSPSVVSFGQTNGSQNSALSNALQELTLNKQGKINVPKAKGSNGAKINPKDLSNEELEYIIKTGKLPQRMMNDEVPSNSSQSLQSQINIPPQPPSYQQQPFIQQQQVQNQIMSNNNPQQFNKTVNTHQFNQNYSFDKENIMLKNTINNLNYLEDSQVNLKNYNSPKQQLFPQNNNPGISQLNPLHLAQNSYIQLDQSTSAAVGFNNKTFTDISTSQSQINQNPTSGSQAASQALKALQEKVKQLENENLLLQDKLHLSENNSKESIQKLTNRLKEEQDKFSHREQMMKEEISLLKLQLDQSESEKHRHLQENSQERDQWRQSIKLLETENLTLKSQMQEHIQKLEEGEVEDIKTRYEDMKTKIKEQKKQLEDEVRTTKEEMDKVLNEKEKVILKLKRESEKWKRESEMIREEMSIVMGNEASKKKGAQTKKDPAKLALPSQGFTPKSSSGGGALISARRCKSPLKDSKVNTQQLTTFQPNQTLEASSQNFQSLESSKKAAGKKQNNKKRTTSTNNQINQSNQEQRNNLQLSSKKSQRQSQHQNVALRSSERKQTVRSSSSAHKRTKSKKSSRPTTNGATANSQSQNNLISINTKEGATGVVDYDLNSSKDDYIFVGKESSNQQKYQFNQFKRPSVESSSSVQFGLSSTTSDYAAAFLYSHQSSVDQQQQQQQSKPMEINEIKGVDNEIFYLEREIFDYNQQYKTLLSQQNSSQHENNPFQESQSSITIGSTSAAGLNQKLRQIAQMLEEKSERLFELKKQQQQMLLRESYNNHNGNLNSGIKAYQIKQNY